jgi:uncharacterized radical SAM superfamily Fe-S cluster-containing enzyme
MINVFSKTWLNEKMLDNDITPLAVPVHGRFDASEQRPLMAMVEITSRCNMKCPVCFAGSTGSGSDLSMVDIQVRLLNLLEVAGPIPLQISGGEPTMHPELHTLIRFCRDRGFKNIELITNGIRIGREPGYLDSLVEHGLNAVYLQFDSLEERSLRAIRGRDMRSVRTAAVEAVRRSGACCTLAAAVTPGVNDSELGDVVQFGIDNIDTVRAINFQAAARFTGRYDLADQREPYRLDELVPMIETQAGIPAGGFLRDIGGHHDCNAMSLVYIIDGRLKPLLHHLSRESLDNFFGTDRREKLLDLFMGRERFARKYMTDPRAWKLLLEGTAIFGSPPSLGSIMKAKHLLIFAKGFMEKSKLDPKRIENCCYGIAAADGVYSFCAYNNLYRPREKPGHNQPC